MSDLQRDYCTAGPTRCPACTGSPGEHVGAYPAPTAYPPGGGPDPDPSPVDGRPIDLPMVDPVTVPPEHPGGGDVIFGRTLPDLRAALEAGLGPCPGEHVAHRLELLQGANLTLTCTVRDTTVARCVVPLDARPDECQAWLEAAAGAHELDQAKVTILALLARLGA